MNPLPLAMATAVTAASLLTAPVAAHAQPPPLKAVVAPSATIRASNGAYAMLLMRTQRPIDKTVCRAFADRYDTRATATETAATYRLYWLAPTARPLSTDDCAQTPPEAGVPRELYDYETSSSLIDDLRLPPRGGPFLVVVKCEADGRRPVNAGYINLARSNGEALPELFGEFEDYLKAPARWTKMRIINRNGVRSFFDLVQTPVRITGRVTGFITRMHDCEA